MNKKLWHGTASIFSPAIEREGLKPEGCTAVPEEFRKSCASKPGYVYFTDDMNMAVIFACGTAKKAGMGKGLILEIDTKDVKVERDPLLPTGSFRHKGIILPDKIKSIKMVDCNA